MNIEPDIKFAAKRGSRAVFARRVLVFGIGYSLFFSLVLPVGETRVGFFIACACQKEFFSPCFLCF